MIIRYRYIFFKTLHLFNYAMKNNYHIKTKRFKTIHYDCFITTMPIITQNNMIIFKIKFKNTNHLRMLYKLEKTIYSNITAIPPFCIFLFSARVDKMGSYRCTTLVSINKNVFFFFLETFVRVIE